MTPLRLHFVTLHAMPSAQAVPLAAAFLTAYLTGRPDPSPVTVSSAEYFCGSDPEPICAGILAAAPDLVAFPVYLWNRAECAELARRLRRLRPGLLLVAGGPEATADPARLLGEAPFDLLAIGEGERTLEELIDRLAAGEPLAGLAGTARLEAGTLVTVPRPPIDDLAEIPSPYLLGLLDRHIAHGMVWQLSRGCSFACDFCYDGMGDRRVRRFPPERLEQELDYLVGRNACQIFALDSTFNTDRKRAKNLLRQIRDRAPDVHFHFEVRHELLDQEQAELFASLTCSLQIGLQSADPAVAGGVGRKFDRKEFTAKVMLLNDSGATFGFDLIYGLPGDRLDTFREGLDFALSLYPNHLDIFPLAVLPGTRVAQRAEEAGLVSLAEPPYTLQASATFPATDMARARAIGAACDIFYSRGKAVAWYNGVVRALKLTPVALLERFADWLTARQGADYDEARFSDEQILELQRSFLSDIFTERKLHKLLPAALDCATYHYHYGVALMAVPPVPPTDEELERLDLSGLRLTLAPSVSLATFTYEILDLLESGEPDLPWIAKNLQRCSSWAAIYPAHGEVCTESLIEPYYRLLEQLDGRRAAGEILASLGLDPGDTADFLTFAVAEGIVTPASRTPSRTH